MFPIDRDKLYGQTSLVISVFSMDIDCLRQIYLAYMLYHNLSPCYKLKLLKEMISILIAIT